MSTEFKELERVNREAAYELQRKVNQIRQDAANAANNARDAAQRAAQTLITQERQQSISRENQAINALREDTSNKLAQQDATHRDALLKQSKLLNTKLSDQSSDFKQRLQNVQNENRTDINRLRTETSRVINELTNDINKSFQHQDAINRNQQGQINTINAELNTIHQQIADVKSDIRLLQSSVTDQQGFAQASLISCQRSIAEFQNDITVRRFQGDELNRVIKSVNAASGNVTSAPQAAIASLTEARIDLLDIKDKASKSQVIFDNLFENTLANVKSLISNINHNSKNTKINDTAVDLDYWTQGKYKTLQQEVGDLETKVNECLSDSGTGIDELQNILEQIFKLEIQEEALVTEAVKQIELSEHRSLTADKVITKLIDEGNFKILEEDDEGYIASDFREGYYATLVNKNDPNINITVSVNSVENDPNFRSRISIQRNDDTHQELTIIEDLRDLMEDALKEGGNEVRRVDVEDKRIFDAAALKNTKLSPAQKARLTN